MKNLLHSILIMLCLGQTMLISQENKKYYNVGIYFDQDVLAEFIDLNEDRNYTQGLGVSWNAYCFQNMFNKFLKLKNPSKHITQLPIMTFQFGGFTPDELRDSLPIIGDRPYSTIAMLTLKDFRVDLAKYRARYWTASVGVLGIPNVAEFLQTSIHKVKNKNNTIPPYNPAGWQNQISHGGEPTLMMSYGIKKLLSTHAIEKEINRGKEKQERGLFRSQLVSAWQMDLGYLTQIQGGFDFRIGSINLKKWHSGSQWQLNSTAAKKEDQRENLKSAYFSGIKNNKEFYLFAGFRAGATLYNGSLHGQFKMTKYRLNYRETGFFNATGRVGIGTSLDCLSLTIFGALKTPEFWNSYSRVHYWGGINLACSFQSKKSDI